MLPPSHEYVVALFPWWRQCYQIPGHCLPLSAIFSPYPEQYEPEYESLRHILTLNSSSSDTQQISSFRNGKKILILNFFVPLTFLLYFLHRLITDCRYFIFFLSLFSFRVFIRLRITSMGTVSSRCSFSCKQSFTPLAFFLNF